MQTFVRGTVRQSEAMRILRKATDFRRRETNSEYVHLVTLVWPWPWPDDLDMQIWPRLFEMYLHTENEVCSHFFQKRRARTRHTDRCDRMHYHAAFAGGENSKVDRAYNICFESEGGERIYLCSVSCRICIRCLATNNKHPNGLWGSANLKMPVYVHFLGGRFWPVK